MATKQFTLLALFLLLCPPIQAAAITITGPSSADPGASFELQIWGDFAGEGLIAGGTTFLWDPALVSLNSITRAFGASDFSCPGSPGCPPPTANSAPIVWGEFLADLIAPTDTPPTLMATISMTATSAAAEATALFQMIDNADLTGGWFGAGFAPIDTPSFGTFQMDIGQISDMDGDTVEDSQDNCLLKPNPQQRDTDGDGIGNLCDPDISVPNDCMVNFDDLLQLELSFFALGDLDTDFNGDGLTNMGDVGVMRQFFFGPPGPSGLPNNCE